MLSKRHTIVSTLLLVAACDLPGYIGDLRDDLGPQSVDAPRIARTFGPAGQGGLDISGPGDLDADGYDDLVASFAGPETTSVCWFFGSDQGLPELTEEHASRCISVPHEPGLTITEGIGMWPIRPTPLGDIDGDATPDLGIWAAQAGHDSHLYVFRGGPQMRDVTTLDDASGTLIVELGSDYRAWPVAPVDVDGNGASDLVLERWYTATSGGDGPMAAKSLWTISAAELSASGSLQIGTPTLLGDFVTDGPEVTIAVNQVESADASIFVEARAPGDPGPSSWGYSQPLSQNEHAVAGDRRLSHMAVADLDCDGDSELLGLSGGALVLYRPGEATSTPELEVTTMDPIWVEVAGDLDGDGCTDLVLGGSQGGFPETIGYRLQLAYGGTTPSLGQLIDLPRDPRIWGYRPLSAAGDVDGDGYDDFFVETDGNFVGDVYDGSRLVGTVAADDPIERVLLYYGGPRRARVPQQPD
jgi:hypothetical protein